MKIFKVPHLFLTLIVLLFFISIAAQAQNTSKALKSQLINLRNMVNSNRCDIAVPGLFEVAYTSKGKFAAEDIYLARQWMSICLYKMGLYQAAAFPLIGNSYQASANVAVKSVDLLLRITDKVNDPSLLNYAVSKIDVSLKNQLSTDLVGLKLAEHAMMAGQLEEAERLYKSVLEKKKENKEALYQLGLIYLKTNKLKLAYDSFEKLSELYQKKSNLDYEKGVANLGLARSLYQAKMWQDSIDMYKSIPRNHDLYRQSLFEMAWAQFRSMKFRAAASTMESLQSQFYENVFDPESLLLRMTIQLFICQFEDLENSMKIYDENYLNTGVQLQQWLAKKTSQKEIFSLIQDTLKKKKIFSLGYDMDLKNTIPYFILRTGLDSPMVRPHLNLLESLKKERKLFRKSALAKNAKVSKFAERIYKSRLATVNVRLIEGFRAYLELTKTQVDQYNKQYDFIKYEFLNSKRVNIKKLTSMSAEEKEQLNANQKRDFYWENGYRYWPFQGESWVDEIGNYQFVGVNRCINE